MCSMSHVGTISPISGDLARSESLGPVCVPLGCLEDHTQLDTKCVFRPKQHQSYASQPLLITMKLHSRCSSTSHLIEMVSFSIRPPPAAPEAAPALPRAPPQWPPWATAAPPATRPARRARWASGAPRWGATRSSRAPRSKRDEEGLEWCMSKPSTFNHIHIVWR